MTKPVLPLLLILAFLLAPQSARSATQGDTQAQGTPASSAAPTPAEAQRTLEMLKDDKKRAALIETLETIAKAAPSAAKPPPVPIPLKADGLGIQLLNDISDWVSDIIDDLGATARAVTDFPQLLHWAKHMIDDPAARARLIDAVWRLAAVLVSALFVEWLVAFCLRRPRRYLAALVPQDAAEPRASNGATFRRRVRMTRAWRRLVRLPFALARLVLDLLPVAAFAAVGNLLLGATIDTSTTTRLIIVAVVNAYALCRVIMCVTRMIVSPGEPHLALLQVSDETAAYIEVWMRRLVSLAIFGGALAGVARILGLYPAAYEALLKVVALIFHLFLVIIVLQCRRGVAAYIRAPETARGTLAVLRNRLADIWHYVAIFVILTSWVIWAVQVRNGLARILHFVVATIIVLGLARLAAIIVLGTLDRLFHVNRDVTAQYPGLEARANRYYPLLRGAISVVIWIITIIALLQAWGFNSLEWFSDGRIGDRVLSAAISIAIASLIAIAVWESANAAMERHMARLSRQAQLARIARLQTLLPMLRSALLIAISTIVGLTALSEIGVNIGPLLAGAGIIGVAIGFGSQKLVQDLITGIFLLLENAMQVGDWVTAAGLSGTVEHLSIRTIRLRAGDGSVHIIPFSAVSTMTNTNRGIGNAAVSVNVSYEEDTDRVGDVLKSIASEMRQDPEFNPAIRSDLQLWGVDKVEGSVVTIVGQIECTDTGRWGVQREFNRRVKKRFQELGIRLANPTHTVVLEPAERAGETVAPEATQAAGNRSDPGPTSASSIESPPPAALGNTQ